MNNGAVFKRHELKYFLTPAQYRALQVAMKNYMRMDVYGRHTIHNVYFDTPDYLLIRRSIEKPCYKEKLRVRSYGTPTADGPVFVELKKKYNGIVYKRRMTLPQNEAFAFLVDGEALKERTQIGKEVAYFMEHYKTLRPAVALQYEREAYFGLWNEEFRMTFDQNVRIRTDVVSLAVEDGFTPVLDDDRILLEVKTSMGIPSWLLAFFGEHEIYKTSFSKYGTAYQKHLLPKLKGEHIYVAS